MEQQHWRIGQLVWPLALALITGCGDDEGISSDIETTVDPVCSLDSYDLVLETDYNYRFSSQVDIKTYEIQEYPNVPTFDWSGVTQDILGHPVDPTKDIGHIEVIAWNLSDYETFEGWLGIDRLQMDRLESMVNLEAEVIAKSGMRAGLDAFGSFGTNVEAEKYFHSVDPFPATDFIFVLVLGRGEVIGYDAITAAFIKPVSDPSAPTDLSIGNDTISLSYQVSLSREAYSVPRHGRVTVDWRELIGQENALGQELTPNQAGEVMLTFYAGKSVAELEGAFLDLEVIADKRFRFAPPDPTPFSLDALTDDQGNAFDGFTDAEGTWLLSLWCTSGCNNPAPKYLAALAPCG